jgi:hypothetical protein
MLARIMSPESFAGSGVRGNTSIGADGCGVTVENKDLRSEVFAVCGGDSNQRTKRMS